VCKHIRAVRITLKRELGMDGSIVETRQLLFEEKKVYAQPWEAYNRAQTTEKPRFLALLHELVQGVADLPCKATGRKPHAAKDSIFAMAYKVYSMFSARRFHSDLQEAHKQGYTTRAVPGMKVSSFFENPAFTPILRQLIARSALPLSAVETKFAVDSSGFATSKFVRWYDEKYGCTRTKAAWVKAHISCGVTTNIVTDVRILDKDAADCPQFKPLVETTAQGFKVDEVSGDKAYLSLENFETVADLGGTAFIQFKANTTGTKGGLFEKMFGFFQYKRDEYLQHYHLRSNVESTFSAVKRKFGDSVRSKNDVAMVNEVLCKFLCHNLTCLIHEQEELGIEAEFARGPVTNLQSKEA
jgi:transposase